VKYLIKTHREDDGFVITFPDAPGCVTECDDAADVPGVATEALEGWLEAHLVSGDVPPRPRPVITGRAVEVGALLALKLELLWARREAGLSQAAVAKLVGVSQQRIAALEHPDTEVKLSTAEAVMRALGRSLALASFPLAPPRKRARLAARAHA